MSANEVHIGDTPTVTLTFKDGTSVVDISGVSTKEVWFADPTGTKVAYSGVFTTDGSDGKLYHTCSVTNIDVAGDWQVQGYVVTAGGAEWHSDVKDMKVYANL